MTIAALVPVVREALGVSSSYDAVTIPAGIRRAIAFLLRTYTFPRALTRETVTLASGSTSIALPATGVGKIHAVRILVGGASHRLRRTLVGENPGGPGPSTVGPQYYWQEGNTLFLDRAIVGPNHSAEVFYNSVDIDDADAWITSDFEDVTFTISCLRLAQELRKPEVLAAFQPSWAELVPTLAQYLNELEFNDLDIRMKPAVAPGPPERYGT